MQRIPESFVNTVVSQDRFKQWETEWTGLFTLFVIKTLKIDDFFRKLYDKIVLYSIIITKIGWVCLKNHSCKL